MHRVCCVHALRKSQTESYRGVLVSKFMELLLTIKSSTLTFIGLGMTVILLGAVALILFN